MAIPAFLSEPITKDDLLPPVDERLQLLPYEQISWENFEKLCHELAKKEKDVTDARAYGVQGNAQDGIDIYATSNAGKHTVYQCKNEKNFSKAKITAAIELFLKGEWADQAEKFVLCSREALNNKSREDEIILQRAALLAKGITLVVWDSSGLDSKLKEYPQLVYDFFGLNWFTGFCGREKLKLIDLHEPLPDKREYLPPDLYLPRTVTRTDEDSIAMLFQSDSPLYDVFQKQRKVALLAWGLNGKSTELRYIAHRIATETDYYPFLETFENYSDEDIASLFPEIARVPQLNVVVLLDGLDEVLPDKFALVTRKIARFLVKYPLVTIIVSCRTNFYTSFKGEKEFNTLKDFESYRLNYLEEKEVHKFLEDHYTAKKEAFMKEVYRKQLQELLVLPYYLVKLARQFDDTGQISDSKAELFRNEVQQLIHQEVGRNYIANHEVLEKKLYPLLKKTAFVMEAMGVNHIGTDDLLKVLPDEQDRKLVITSASIFHGSENSEKIWKFHHHNTQEFLAADTLTGKPFSFIKKIIGIAPEYQKAKPLWVNAILFLNSILQSDSPLKAEIIDWLTAYNRDLLIKLDPENLEMPLKEKIFREIFNLYKFDDRRINANLFRYEDLANFSQGPETFDFLLTELRASGTVSNLANTLSIINYFQLNKYPTYLPLFKAELQKILFGHETELHHLAIISYTVQGRLNEAEFENVFEKFNETEDNDIRPALFEAIQVYGYSEKYLNYVMSATKLLIDEYRKSLGGGEVRTHHSSGGPQIAGCLECIQTEVGLLQIFTVLEEYLLGFGHSGAFGQSLAILMKHAAALTYGTNVKVQIIKVFKANHSYILHDLKASVLFMDYFRQNELIDQICNDLCNSLHPNDASMINTISLMADKSSIDLLVNLLAEGKIDVRTIDSFNYFLEKNDNAQLQYFRQLFTIPPPIEKPKREFEKIEAERHVRDLVALFDKEKFKEEITLIFSGFGKDSISYDDLNYSDPDYWSEKYCSIARDLLGLRPNIGEISLLVYLNSVDNNWERHYYTRIYDYLVKNPKAVLSDEQRNVIINWCNLQSGLSSFTNGIEQTDSHNWTMDHNLTMFSFFIRSLNILSYVKTLYLDMLSFIKYDDSLIEIFDFVATIPGMTSENITEQVLVNLTKGITNVRSLDYHLDYVKKNKVKEAAVLLPPYLNNNNTVNRPDILKIFLELGGNLNDLKGPLVFEDSEFRPYIIEEFVKTNSPFIRSFLREKFATEKDEKKKLYLAKYLIRLQEVSGLKFYLNYIRNNKRVPDDSSPVNPLFSIYEAEFTYQVLEMVKLSQDSTIIHDDFRDLRSISFNCLRNLVVYPGNYKHVKRKITLWTLKQKVFSFFNNDHPYTKFINTLKLYMEGIEQQFNVNNSKVFKIDEALALYKAASEKA